jgi:hypothetical protein
MTLDIQPEDDRKFILKVILVTLIAFVIVLLSSCSCEFHLDKVQKKCGINSFTDTLTVHDTIIVPSVRKDTVFHLLQKDTVIVEKGKLTMKYFYNTKDSTVYLKGDCKTDTIIKSIKVPYTKQEIVYSIWNSYKWWIIGFIALCLLIILIMAFK